MSVEQFVSDYIEKEARSDIINRNRAHLTRHMMVDGSVYNEMISNGILTVEQRNEIKVSNHFLIIIIQAIYINSVYIIM